MKDRLFAVTVTNNFESTTTMNKLARKICGAVMLISFLYVNSSAGDELAQKLERASVFLETGKPDSAAVLLYNIADSPVNSASMVRALYYLSEALGQLGRFDEKRQYLTEASALDPNVEFADKVRFSLCRILLKSGEFDECIKLAGEFRQHYNNSLLLPEVLYMSGNAYLEKGEYQRAFNILNDIIKNHRNSAAAGEAVLKSGICLYKLEFIAGSIRNFEKYLVETPQGMNTGEALYFLGLAYERTRQPQPAGNAFKRLTMQYPSYPEFMDALFRLGKNLFGAGDFPEAENAFLNYIANSNPPDNKHDEARYYLERINFKTGKYYSEIQIAENFISKYPESPRSPFLIFDLARYYSMARKTSKAAEYYMVLLKNEIYASYADSAAILLADTYVAAKRKENAASFLAELADQKKNTSSAQVMLYKLGSLYEKWGLYDVAIAWYDSSLSVNLSADLSVRALWGIGRSLVKVNRWLDAEKTYERIFDEYPKNRHLLNIHLELSRLFYDQGRIEDSIREAENALKYAKGADKADILLFAAGLYEEVDEKHALQLYSLIYNNEGNVMDKRSNALLKYADLAWRMGDRISATNAYAKVITDSADSSSVNRARRRLDLINAQADSLKD